MSAMTKRPLPAMSVRQDRMEAHRIRLHVHRRYRSIMIVGGNQVKECRAGGIGTPRASRRDIKTGAPSVWDPGQ